MLKKWKLKQINVEKYCWSFRSNPIKNIENIKRYPKKNISKSENLKEIWESDSKFKIWESKSKNRNLKNLCARIVSKNLDKNRHLFMAHFASKIGHIMLLKRDFEIRRYFAKVLSWACAMVSYANFLELSPYNTILMVLKRF